MQAAAFIEFMLTHGTSGRIHIFMNGQLVVAATTKNSELIPQVLRPTRRFMVRQFLMAGITSIIFPTTMEADGDNIDLTVIMGTACLVIHLISFYERCLPHSTLSFKYLFLSITHISIFLIESMTFSLDYNMDDYQKKVYQVIQNLDDLVPHSSL